MKKRKLCAIIQFILVCGFNIIVLGLNAQEVIILSKNVGAFIDSTENLNYLLFPDYLNNDFIGAQILKSPEEKYTLLIYQKNSETLHREIQKEDLRKLRRNASRLKNEYQKNDTINYYSIFLNDGTVLIGRILSQRGNHFNLKSASLGEVRVPASGINEIRCLNLEEISSSDLYKNEHASRYFYAPSSIPMQKGEGYFQDIYLVFVSANYSITNHLIVGGGFTILPGVNINEQAYFVNMKAAYPWSDKLYVGGGGLFFNVGAANTNIAIGYGVITYGSLDHNATFGLGYGFESGNLMNSPVVTVCGMTRLSKRIAFMTENWMFTVTYTNETEMEIAPGNIVFTDEEITETFYVLSYGLRFFSHKISVDLAFINIPNTGELFFPGIPYLDFVVRF